MVLACKGNDKAILMNFVKAYSGMGVRSITASEFSIRAIIF